MLDFARLTLLVAMLAFSVQANERAKVIVAERKASQEVKAMKAAKEAKAKEAKDAKYFHREGAMTQGYAKDLYKGMKKGADKPL